MWLSLEYHSKYCEILPNRAPTWSSSPDFPGRRGIPESIPLRFRRPAPPAAKFIWGLGKATNFVSGNFSSTFCFPLSLCLALALSTLLQSSKVPKLFRMERNSRLLPVARKLNLGPALNPVSDMHVEKNGSNCYAWNYFDVVTRNPTQACQQDIHSNCPFVTSSTPRPPIIWNAMRCRRPLQ